MSDPTPVYRCAAASLERGDPPAGSAPPAQRWLLLEHPGPWRVDAVAGSDIEPEMLRSLTKGAAQSGTRILLVRRPGRAAKRDSRQTSRGWQLVSQGSGTVSGRWVDDRDLHLAVAAMSEPPASGRREPSEPSEPSEPVILVCTHGVHDACCAIRGRPVAAALVERWPGQVWECSHVGGDRFAPNVVVLPDGFYYGNLTPETAVTAVQAHLYGAVVTENLRGMAGLPPAVQAAAVAAHARFGPMAPADVVVLEHAAVSGGRGPTTDVRLALPDARVVRARVVAFRRPAAQLTCRAERATPAMEYQVASLADEAPA